MRQFLWGYLKDKVFSTPPQNIDELRQRIDRESMPYENSLPSFIQRAVSDMHRRTMLCVEREGGHVQGTALDCIHTCKYCK
jgi:hypothetical protein